MDETLFYVFGIALIISAAVVSFAGLRIEGFPGSRAILGAVVLYFALMVGATTTFAVLNAADEQHKREAEEAASTTAEETTTTPQGTTQTTTVKEPNQGKTSTVDVSADASQLAFQQKSLSTSAGQVTVDFDNPSAVGHDVCIRSESGDELGCTQVITDSKTTLNVSLDSGSYTYYCDVDGHEQAGMSGKLTVK